ncbi:MAG: hypothetical protein QW382_07080 [Nitrososphaerota archaeon]
MIEMGDYKIRVKAEEYRKLVSAFPKLLEKYGMKMGLGTAMEWKYCYNCGYYFTKNLENLYRCPICGKLLRSGSKIPKKAIDPEKILGGG